jgi:hypothetical protein
MRKFFYSMLAAALLPVALPAAAETFVYPADGQSDEQMNKDKGECRQWAVNESGIDPANVSSGSAQKSVVGGAAKGAALGAIGGAIAGNAGKGAGIGAAVAAGGTVIGNRRRQADANQNADAARATYQRAYVVCLEGRGYTVK